MSFVIMYLMIALFFYHRSTIYNGICAYIVFLDLLWTLMIWTLMIYYFVLISVCTLLSHSAPVLVCSAYQ